MADQQKDGDPRAPAAAAPPGLAGGLAEKLGNRYEGRWTIACLGILLKDDWEHIDLEPYDGVKIEFHAQRRDGVVEHHQAKRTAPGGGNWTRPKLEREGLIDAIDHWTGPDGEFVLVSGSPVDPHLRNLVVEARKSADAASFLASLPEERMAELRGLQTGLGGVSDERAWLLLRRLQFRTIDEDTLADLAIDRLAHVVEGDPAVARAHFGDYLDLHIGERVTSTGLWQFLSERGVRRRDWGSDPDLRAAVEHQTRRFLGDPDESTILNLETERHEAREAVDFVTAVDGPQVTVLTAAAGMGKSVVVRQAVADLARNYLTLPIRLDNLTATATADDLGQRLGLRGSPVQVLGHLAAGEKAVLVIDQLDAVSDVSGRYGRGFEAVAEMLGELVAFPNVRLLLACRDFDLEVDRRLRRIRDREGTKIVTVSLLEDEFIDRVLEAAGVRTAQLSKAQREIVRVPLHLRLLAESAGTGRGFSTELDLFDAYWDEKRRSVGSRGGDEAAASGLLEDLVLEMSQRQELEVPADVGSGRPVELQLLESEHVLIHDDRRVRFFHERFFDYAFARAFARRGESLAAFLTGTTQGLFRRSQARQILSYRRAADRPTYLRDLRETLLDPRIRLHIKTVIVAWLRTLADPCDEEWEVLRTLLDRGDERLRGHVLTVLSGSPAMFDLADAAGTFSGWLGSSDDTVKDRAVLVLSAAQRSRPARVAELLGALDCSDERNRQRLTYAVRQADLTLDESFFEFFLDLLTVGCLDELRRVFASNDTFWELSHGLPEKRPERAARFVRAYVDRRLVLASESGVADPFDDPDWIPHPLERDIFSKIAAGAPAAYAQQILSLVLRLIHETGTWNAEEQRFDDNIWRWRMFGDAYSVSEGLLKGLEDALRRLADWAPDDFNSHRAALEAATSSTADHVLARAYAAAPRRFATEAAAWLVANTARLDAGYVDASHWVGRELVAAIWPHLETGARESLERAIVSYYPTWERSKAGHRSHGNAQYTILSGIPEEDLSDAGRRRVAELRRKFQAEPSPPRGIQVGRVGSPVPATALSKMSDAQWLSALREYVNVEDRPGRRAFLAGGALELGRQLQEQTKADPDRFARLGMGLEDDLAIVYGEQILLGIREADDPSAELVFDLVRRLHRLPGRPCGRFLADAVAKFAPTTPLPDEIVDVVAWYAVSSPDPTPGYAREAHERNDPVRLGLIDAGINTVRGDTAHAIARILQSEIQPIDRWRDVIAATVHDDSDGVRSCVAGVLLVCLDRDRDWVVDLALELFDEREDVATSADAEKLIRFGLRTHPDLLLPVVARLVASEDEAVGRVGARLACVAAFSVEQAGPLAAEALVGNAGARLGAAEIYANAIGVDAYRAASRNALMRLFDDPDPKVRREAGTCFQALRGTPLAGEEDLFLAYAAASGIADNAHDVLDALLEAPSLPPRATVAVCRAVVDAAGGEAGSVASAWSAQMPDVATLAARLQAHPEEEARDAGLDLIDSLAANGAYGLERAVAPFER
jgi:hypothetical protein